MKIISNRKPTVKAAAPVRQIVIPLTERQYQLVVDICRSYRLTPEEFAVSALLTALRSTDDEDNMLGYLQEAVAGHAVAWKDLEQELKKLSA